MSESPPKRGITDLELPIQLRDSRPGMFLHSAKHSMPRSTLCGALVETLHIGFRRQQGGSYACFPALPTAHS